MIIFLITEILLALIAICCIQCGNYGNNIYLLESTPSKDKIQDLISRERNCYLICKYGTIVLLLMLIIIVLI